MAILPIGEVARRTGLAASALRYYEGELLPPAARSGGKRVYDESILGRLALIRLAQSAGFSIAEIRTLLSGFSKRTPPSARWERLAVAKRAELDEQIRRARAMRQVLDSVLQCECPTLDDCGRALAECGHSPSSGR